MCPGIAGHYSTLCVPGSVFNRSRAFSVEKALLACALILLGIRQKEKKKD